MRILATLTAFVFFSWLMLISGMEPAYVGVGVALVWWACVFSYRFATSRNFFDDVAPWLIAPFIPLRLVFSGYHGLSSFARRVGAARRRQAEAIKVRSIGDLVSDRATLMRSINQLRLPVGYNSRRVVFADLDDDRHLAITGATGEGKTSVVLTMILALLASGEAGLQRINVSLHDPKRVLSNVLRRVPPTGGFRVFGSIGESLTELGALVGMMVDRTDRMGQAGVLTIDELGLPHILVVIDEPQIYFHQDKGYEDLVYQLVTSGRQAGIHVVLVTPYAHGDVISTKYRVNLKFISGHLRRHAENVLQMPVSQLGEHEFLYQKSERSVPIHMLSFHITGDDIQAVIAGLSPASDHPTVDDIALQVFISTPNCGVKTLLRNARNMSALLGDIPAPLTGVTPQVRGFSYSKEAIEWGLAFLRRLEELGIASAAPTGKSRTALVDYDQAKKILRES